MPLSAPQQKLYDAPVEIRKQIARLKAARQYLGWSEEACAHHLGVTHSTLSRWERGQSLPKSRLIIRAIDQFLTRFHKGIAGATRGVERTGGRWS